MQTLRPTFAGFALVLAGCGRPSQMPAAPDWDQFVLRRPNASGSAGESWRPEICAGVDLHPDYHTLDETSLAAFLQNQQLTVRVERQPVEPNKPELVFLFVSAASGSDPIALRVAMLKTPDEAGRDLYDAVLQHGSGSWGVRRANVAVLGPPGSSHEDLAFAAKTKLACWGTFLLEDDDDAVVIPGGYAEP
jgi:hypothetical protein